MSIRETAIQMRYGNRGFTMSPYAYAGARRRLRRKRRSSANLLLPGARGFAGNKSCCNYGLPCSSGRPYTYERS